MAAGLVMGSALAQNFEQPVTFEARAATTSQVLAELSRTTGINFMVNSLTGRDVIAVRAKGVPLIDVINGIANATGSGWVEEESGWRLVRSSADEDAQRSVDLETRAEKVRQAILRDQGEVRSEGSTFDAQKFITAYEEARNQPRNQRNYPRSASQRALLAIAASLKPADLAAIWDERVVYATSPTRMQRPLPNNATTVIQNFLRDEIAVHRIMESRDRNNRRVPYERNVDRFLNAPVGKAHVVVTRSGDNIQLELTIADMQGDRAVDVSYTLRLDPDQPNTSGQLPGGSGSEPLGLPDSVRAAAGSWVGPPQLMFGGDNVSLRLADLGEQLQQLSSDQGQLLRLMEQEATSRQASQLLANYEFIFEPETQEPGQEVPAIASTLRTARTSMTRPTEIDPLSGHPSDLLWAMYGDDNFVACLPDSLVHDTAQFIGNANATRGMAWQMALGAWGLTRDKVNSVEVLKPADMSDARDRRVSRPALEKLVQHVIATGDLRLDTLAEYALNAPYKGDSTKSLDVRVMRQIREDLDRQMMRVHSEEGDVLRIYGSLSPQARQQNAAQGGQLVNTLPGAGRDNVYSLVFYSRSGPQIMIPREGGRGNTFAQNVPGEFQRQQREQERRMQRADVERTDALPTGLPQGASVQIVIRRSDQVRAIESATGRSRTMSPQQLGQYRAQLDDPRYAERRPRMTQYNAFVPVSRVDYQIIIRMGENITLTRNLTDMAEPPGVNPAGYDGLPNNIRSAIDEAYKRAADRGRGGG